MVVWMENAMLWFAFILPIIFLPIPFSHSGCVVKASDTEDCQSGHTKGFKICDLEAPDLT